MRVHALLAVAVLLAGCSNGGSKAPGSDRTSTRPAQDAASSTHGYSGDLPPLPKVQFASSRPEPLLRAAYEFAARHPDVLKYMPCFCGCERNGHGSNADCFIARRDADGRPEWNPHGIGCGICIDVALQAKQLHSAGTPIADIRRAIDAKHRADYPTSTPTPMPPAH